MREKRHVTIIGYGTKISSLRRQKQKIITVP